MSILPLEGSPKGGRPAKDNRTFINAIIWLLRTGAPWRALAEEYGSWNAVYSRFRRWQSFCGVPGKALETRGAKYERIHGAATLATGLDEKKSVRVMDIGLGVSGMDEKCEFIFERVEKII